MKHERRTREMFLTDELTHYATMGRAALIPGMVEALKIMQDALDKMRTELAAMQGCEAMGGQQRPHRRNGRLPKTLEAFAALEEGATEKPRQNRTSGWSDDPEERKAEMQRRMAKRKGSKG